MSETTSPYAGAVPLISVFVLVYLGIGGWRYLNARIANEKAESAARVKQLQEQPITQHYDAPATGIVTSEGAPHPSFPQTGVVKGGAAYDSFVGKCDACGEVRVFPLSNDILSMDDSWKGTRWWTRCLNPKCTSHSVDVWPTGSGEANEILRGVKSK